MNNFTCLSTNKRSFAYSKESFPFFQEMPSSSLPLVSLFAWSKEMFTKDANVSYNNAFFFHQLSQAQIDWRSFQKETRTNVAFKRRTHSLVLPQTGVFLLMTCLVIFHPSQKRPPLGTFHNNWIFMVSLQNKVCTLLHNVFSQRFWLCSL